VTDANLLLARMRPENFLGGDFVLDAERAARITREWLRRQRSSLSLEQFALGVIRVVNANMERALRVVSIERGYDPRDFTLVAFGGAGGLHACELAQALGIPRVIVPAMPGALSAYGILVSDVVKDYSRTVLWQITGRKISADITRRLRGQLESFAQKAREDFRSEGWPPPAQLSSSADLRYLGQGYELNIPLRSFTDTRFLQRFHQEHHRRYAYSQAGNAVEIVTLRLRASRLAPAVRSTAPNAPSHALSPGFANVNFGGRQFRTAIIPREALRTRQRHRGPAIVTEYSGTTVVPPGMSFGADAAGNLLIESKN
jgi:N-methylhydantoinase A